MKTKLSFAVSMALAASLRVSAADYETAQQLRDGDLLSADVLNDILERIELSLKPITGSELVGDWRVTQHTCLSVGTDCTGAPMLDAERATFTWDPDFKVPAGDVDDRNPFSNRSAGTRQHDLTITSSSEDRFSLRTTSSLFFSYSVDVGTDLTGDWTCKILSGISILCHKDNDPRVIGKMDISRSSPNQFKLTYNFRARNFNVLVLNKYVDTPTGPTRLTSASAANGNKLTWQDNSNDETAFVIKRKSSIDGTYAELATADANVVTFTDTAVTQDATYWYRVGARNASGDSLYSNAVRHKTNTVTSN